MPDPGSDPRDPFEFIGTPNCPTDLVPMLVRDGGRDDTRVWWVCPLCGHTRLAT